MRGQALIKRTIDVVGAASALLLAGIPMVAVASAIRAKMGSPVLFRQDRPGVNGRIFRLYKFRTMLDSSPGEAPKTDQDRLVPLGRWLRKTSLDELPELFNVLTGDMSLVGPRPLLPRYLDRYSPEQTRRHEMRPGITGWAQVNGRNAITWEERLGLDVWYIDNWSAALDMKILWMTLKQVVNRQGINAEGHATMPEFMRSDDAPTTLDG